MTLCIDVQVAKGLTPTELPDVESFESWVKAALAGAQYACVEGLELSLRIVDEAEIQDLNNRFRGKNKPTNVLSFPFDIPPGLTAEDCPMLGDIVICQSVVEREAIEQAKTQTAHWAHMVIHGCLHLIGYDHIEDDEAEEMENLERRILASLRYPDPYGLLETIP